ncbi:MAG TPA: alpha/beta hydrolase [Burkholderiales bacterium]
MAHITTKDGVKLHYEEAGAGTPIVFVHEFAGDLRSWEPQFAHFSRRYRCIAYNARGYPPSDVPESMERYSQEFARDDVLAVLDGLKLQRAHVVGLSMGGFAALHFGIKYSARALGLVVAGCGYGAHPALREAFRSSARANAKLMLEEGMAKFAATYGHGPTRLQLRDKDPRGFARYIEYLTEHSALGSANTMLGCQARRPSLYDLKKEMAGITAPTLVVAGDEDDATLEPGLLMKRTIPGMGLVVLPRSGHALNLEDPALFNRIVEDFFHQVESGRWA